MIIKIKKKLFGVSFQYLNDLLLLWEFIQHNIHIPMKRANMFFSDVYFERSPLKEKKDLIPDLILYPFPLLAQDLEQRVIFKFFFI